MDERGSLVIEVTVLVGIALMLVLAAGNVAVNGYVKGVVHSAADQGARAGAHGGDPVAACELRARQVLDSVLSGIAAAATVSCADDGQTVAAFVAIHLPGWAPGLPDADIAVTGTARTEVSA